MRGSGTHGRAGDLSCNILGDVSPEACPCSQVLSGGRWRGGAPDARCTSESTLCPRGRGAQTGWELKKHLLNKRTTERKGRSDGRHGTGELGAGPTRGACNARFYRQMAAHGPVQPRRLPAGLPGSGTWDVSSGLLRPPARLPARPLNPIPTSSEALKEKEPDIHQKRAVSCFL